MIEEEPVIGFTEPEHTHLALLKSKKFQETTFDVRQLIQSRILPFDADFKIVDVRKVAMIKYGPNYEQTCWFGKISSNGCIYEGELNQQ